MRHDPVSLLCFLVSMGYQIWETKDTVQNKGKEFPASRGGGGHRHSTSVHLLPTPNTPGYRNIQVQLVLCFKQNSDPLAKYPSLVCERTPLGSSRSGKDLKGQG